MLFSNHPHYNFFTLLLSEALTDYEIKTEGTPDLVIFGPFGNTWKEWVGVPKVHFSGEWSASVAEADLNITMQHMEPPSDKELRLPFWITHIDWFGADLEKLVNPKPIPLEWCTHIRAGEIERKKKFCAFVVTNPTCHPSGCSASSSLTRYCAAAAASS